MRKKYKNIAVLGLGWTGASLIIDFMVKFCGASEYPDELDFYRSPKGLMYVENKKDLIYFSIRHIKNKSFDSLKIILKLKGGIYLFEVIKNNIIEIILCISSFIRTIFIHQVNVKNESNRLLRNILENYKNDSNLLVLDQPCFIEQISLDVDYSLENPIYIIVLRDISDQIEGLLRRMSFLKPHTIRECFFTFAPRTIFADNSFINNENNLIQHILISAVQRLEALVEKQKYYGDRILIFYFEDFIAAPDFYINRIYSLLGRRYLSDDFQAEINYVKKSKKNVGIASQNYYENPNFKQVIGDYEDKISQLNILKH